MTERATDDADDRRADRATPDASTPALAAEVVVSQDGPAECTLFPADATGLARLTTWITAEEGSFVSLEDRR
mgnify:CR=1 FL=1